MAISPEAIDKFLNKVHADLPRFKGAEPDDLRALIFGCTGREYEEVTQSRPHQLEGVAFALYMRRALLLYWMRLGKTKMALDWASQLRRAMLAKKKGLLLAPGPAVAYELLGQVPVHSALRAVLVPSGDGAADTLFDALEGDCDLIILSASTMQSLFSDKRASRKGTPKLYPAYDLLRACADYFDHVIIDEIHRYSNPYGVQFAQISALASQCKYRLGLTGTPVGRHPYPLWAQMFLIDEGVTFGYRYEFFVEAFSNRQGKYEYGRTFDKQKMPVFQYKLDSRALSYGEGEVKSAEIFSGVVRLRMNEDQKKHYRKILEDALDSRLTADEIKETFSKLRRVASGYFPFRDAEGKALDLVLSNPKLDWLREYAENAPDDVQCVVFHEYIKTGELIADMLGKLKKTHVRLYGATSDKQRPVAEFKAGKAQWLVANTASGGLGIDLANADYLCFFETPTDPRVRAQATQRPMARPVDRPLYVDDLVCSPVEERVLSFIEQGRDMLEALTRGERKNIRDFLKID